MASIELVLAISAGFVGILTLFVLFSTGSVIAVLALWLVVGLIVLVLWYYGFIDMNVFNSTVAPTPAPTPPTPAQPTGPVVGSEVFHIDESQFTYSDAPAVCAAYGAELATLEQIIEAYNRGAEWCGYGWSAGGFALYPTQKATWQALQAEPDSVKRTACGRPGVNGGYFDPNTKFGVNCYGFKPSGGKVALPLPPPGTDSTAFKAAVAKFKAMIGTLTLTPYSRNEWSGYDSTVASKTSKAVSYGSQFVQSGLTEGFEQGDQTVSEAPTSSKAASAAPYGLKGDTGPAGPIGKTGPTGAKGADSTVVGPTGAKGDKGDKGLDGGAGAASSVPGPAGAAGPAGPAGAAGAAGVMGPTGPTGTFTRGIIPARVDVYSKDPIKPNYYKNLKTGGGHVNEWLSGQAIGTGQDQMVEVDTDIFPGGGWGGADRVRKQTTSDLFEPNGGVRYPMTELNIYDNSGWNGWSPWVPQNKTWAARDPKWVGQGMVWGV
jgi:hypothetical protein